MFIQLDRNNCTTNFRISCCCQYLKVFEMKLTLKLLFAIALIELPISHYCLLDSSSIISQYNKVTTILNVGFKICTFIPQFITLFSLCRTFNILYALFATPNQSITYFECNDGNKTLIKNNQIGDTYGKVSRSSA